jgi:CheY-like chemotaxis protein
MASGTETVLATERAMTATVLIVDDENTTRDLCRDIVVESGLRTRTAATTEQALEILEQYPVDIIITDLRVSEIGGLELLKRVRETNPLTGILGNAELVLSHRSRLPPADAQRLQTVVDLAVRLRETTRRLSNALEAARIG